MKKYKKRLIALCISLLLIFTLIIVTISNNNDLEVAQEDSFVKNQYYLPPVEHADITEEMCLELDDTAQNTLEYDYINSFPSAGRYVWSDSGCIRGRRTNIQELITYLVTDYEKERSEMNERMTRTVKRAEKIELEKKFFENMRGGVIDTFLY